MMCSTTARELNHARYEFEIQIMRKPLIVNNNSPLLRLPAELRNQIYSYIFKGKTHVLYYRLKISSGTCALRRQSQIP
jgi:hypothetical protein